MRPPPPSHLSDCRSSPPPPPARPFLPIVHAHTHPLPPLHCSCLDEADLLKVRLSVPARALQPAYNAAAPVTLLPQLLELVPALAPYKKIIDDIIKGVRCGGICMQRVRAI